MSIRTPSVVVSVVVFLALRPVTGVDFELRFEGCPPAIVEGPAGGTLTFTVFPTITTSNNPGPGGVGGWQYGIEIIGATLQSATLSGIVVSTVYDEDGDPLTPPVDPKPFDLKNATLNYIEPASDPADSSGKGFVSAVILDAAPLSGKIFKWLHPTGTEKMAKVVIGVTVPDSEAGQVVTLRYVEGFQGTKPPVDIGVGFSTESWPYKPSLTSCTFTVRKRTGGLQRPGDANQDGLLNITDVIWILNHLFLGTEPKLPCEGGTSGSPGIGDLALLDFSDDGWINIVDPIAMLAFLFMGGDPPHIGSDCTAIAGCLDKCGQ